MKVKLSSGREVNVIADLQEESAICGSGHIRLSIMVEDVRPLTSEEYKEVLYLASSELRKLNTDTIETLYRKSLKDQKAVKLGEKIFTEVISKS
jgi:hypothetical protein